MSKEIKAAMAREGQLDLLAYVIILALLCAAALFLFSLRSGAHATGPLGDEYVRITVAGLLLMLVLYLLDQHNRLRRRILQVHGDLEDAEARLRLAHDRLQFSYRAAELMSSLTEKHGLHRVLEESLVYFSADAAAVVGDDIDLVTAEGADAGEAQRVLMRLALDAVRSGEPIGRADEELGDLLAVPLRVQGSLRSVCCLWRRDSAFDEGQLEGLRLVARVIEMTLENQQLLDATNSRLEGTIAALQGLVEVRLPGYTGEAGRIADRSVDIGILLGMDDQQLADLRIAASLHDVGMLKVPSSILNAQRPLTTAEQAVVRRHAAAGAGIACDAHLSPAVQTAILSHHERLDGSGYPAGLTGARVPTMARIIAVVDAYEAMLMARPYREAFTSFEAVRRLQRDAGTRYDPAMVDALLVTLGKPPVPELERTGELVPLLAEAR